MRILFRTDCDDNQGMGHVMRCAALARSFLELGAVPTFACSKPEGVAFVRSSGFGVLDLVGLSRESELRILGDYSKAEGVLLIVADSYDYDARYLASLNAIAKVAYIDDLHTPGLDVEAIANGNVTADKGRYGELYPMGKPKLFLGAEYCLLREEFCGLGSFAVSERVGSVLVASGGSDPHGTSVQIVETLLECPAIREAEIDVMAGPLSGSMERLRMLSARFPRVVVRQGVDDVAGLIRSSDMAVSAAGGTLNEICACGVPSIAYALANNQMKALQAFSSRNCVLNAAVAWSEGFKSCLGALVENLAANRELRCSLSENARRLFDGMGTRRLVDGLLSVFGGDRRGV